MADPIIGYNIDNSELPPPAPGLDALPAPEAPALKSQPINQLTVIDPDGDEATIPIDWLLNQDNLKTFQEQGYSFKPDTSAIPDQVDLTEDGQVKLVNKSDGRIALAPLDWYKNSPEASNFAPESKYKPSSTQDEKMEDVKDKDGNYRLKGLGNDSILVKEDMVLPLLQSGAFKFANDKFQKKFEDEKSGFKKDLEEVSAPGLMSAALAGGFGIFGGIANIVNPGTGYGLAAGALKSIPGGNWALKQAAHSGSDTNALAQNLAKQDLLDTEFQKEQAVGEIYGTVAQAISPTGIFGEAKLANAAKTALLAKMAPKGASFGKVLLAKGLAGAAEGAILNLPQAIAQATLDENPKAAAESLGLGAGIGAFLGFGGGVLSKGAEVTKDLAGKGVDKISPFLKEKAYSKLGVDAGDIKEVESEFMQALRAEGLSGKSTSADILEATRKISKGESFMPTIGKLEKYAEKPINVTDVANTMDNELTNWLQSGHIKPDANTKKAINAIKEELFKYADKKGNISMTGLKKFENHVFDNMMDWKELYKDSPKLLERNFVANAAWNAATEHLTPAIFEAAQKADAKLVDDVSRWVSIETAASQFHRATYTLKEPELRGVTKQVIDLLGNKAGATALGAVGGGPAGAILGDLIGDKVIKPAKEFAENAILKSYEKNSGAGISGWLARSKAAGAVGSLMAIDAVRNMDMKIKEIPTFIKEIGSGVKGTALRSPPTFTADKDPIKSILGQDADGLSKSQQFDKLASTLAKSISDPAAMQRKFDLQIAPLFKDHPKLAEQMFADYTQKNQVLNKIVNGYNTKEPQAFQGKEKKPEPTPAQRKEIEDQLRVVVNPYVILDGLKTGKVTAKQVALVAELNPALLQKMRDELVKTAYSGNSKLSYQQRLAASIIMGAPMDPSLKNGAALQATYGGNAQPVQPQGAAPQPQKQGNSKPLKPKSFASYTASQRIASL